MNNLRLERLAPNTAMSRSGRSYVSKANAEGFLSTYVKEQRFDFASWITHQPGSKWDHERWVIYQSELHPIYGEEVP